MEYQPKWLKLRIFVRGQSCKLTVYRDGFSMYGFAVTDAAGSPTAMQAKKSSTSQWTLERTSLGQLSSYRCLTVVPTQSAPTLTKQPTLAVQSLTTATESGRSEKKSQSVKDPMTSAHLHAVFRSRFSTVRATSSSTSRPLPALLELNWFELWRLR